LLIVTIFAHYVAATNLYHLVTILFALSQLSLVSSLILFIQDMTMSLRAQRAELRDQV
jgi:hypothetical protein